VMRALLRKLLYWLAPSIELGDRAFVETAALRADVASLSLRLRVAEQRLAEWERQAKALTQIVALHSRDLAWLSAQPVQQLGSLSARIAAIELLVMPPVYDGPVSDGRLDRALEKALESMAEVES
jgi:hypothetical protein